jgi:hypothetical protein
MQKIRALRWREHRNRLPIGIMEFTLSERSFAELSGGKVVLPGGWGNTRDDVPMTERLHVTANTTTGRLRPDPARGLVQREDGRQATNKWMDAPCSVR